MGTGRPLALILLTLGLLVTPLRRAEGRPGDRAAVEAAYDGYRQALLRGDAGAASSLVDAGTLAYYGRMKELALTAPARIVRKLGLLDRLMVVTLRHRVEPRALAAMSARDLFEHAVHEGWIGKESVGRLDLGEVKIRGATATASVLTGGKPVGLTVRFRREDGSWRLSLLSLMPAAEAGFAAMARQRKVSEDELIVDLLGKISGKPVPARIWDPPKLKKGGKGARRRGRSR